MNHPHHRLGPEDGITLIELLVVMAISLVVAGIIFGFLETTTSVVARTSNDVQAENDGRLALRTMTQDIRAANPAASHLPAPPLGPARRPLAGQLPVVHHPAQYQRRPDLS